MRKWLISTALAAILCGCSSTPIYPNNFSARQIDVQAPIVSHYSYNNPSVLTQDSYYVEKSIDILLDSDILNDDMEEKVKGFSYKIVNEDDSEVYGKYHTHEISIYFPQNKEKEFTPHYVFDTLSHELAHDAWNSLSQGDKDAFRTTLKTLVGQYEGIRNVSNGAIRDQGLTPSSYSSLSYWMSHEKHYRQLYSDFLETQTGSVDEEKLEELMASHFNGTEAFAFLGDFEVSHRRRRTPGTGIPKELKRFYSGFLRDNTSEQ